MRSPSGSWAALRERVFTAANRRSWTIEANDGIIATAGFLEGFAGAGASERVLLFTASIATIVGGLTVGGANWAEAAAEREAQLIVAEQERQEIAAQPEAELDELVRYWESKGLSPDLARRVAQELNARDALAAQLEWEHGFVEPMSADVPIWAGTAAGGAYVLGALIPVLITYFVPVAIETWAILLAVGVALTFTSLVSARSAQLSASRMLVRSLLVGAMTMTVSYVAGRLLL